MKIEDLEKALQYFVIAVPESEGQAKAYFWARKGITALRSMQEAGEPLSLEQLKQMDGKPVFLETGEVSIGEQLIAEWEILNWSGTGFFNFTRKKRMLHENNYGKTWLAYPYPPAHIDRSEWISVKERLPERFEHVLVYCKKHRGDIFVSCGYRYDNTGWYVDGIYTTVVTHWMPLPEPPEEG